MSKLKLIEKYILQHLPSVIMFSLFILIFAIIFVLYNIKLEALLYASLLCTILAAGVIAVSFIRFCKAHKEREHILRNILIMTENLPEPKNLAEEDYLEMISQLREVNRRNITHFQNERKESIEYYSTWVHQIKTPISVMNMILQTEDTEEHRELAAELFRIEQYVEMVLCYLRLDSSSSDFVFSQYDLNKIIRNAIRKFASQFVRKRIQLKYEPTDITVLTDEKWLSFIIEQILSNAVKYTERGCVNITVTEDKLLKISDTGIGISAEDIPRIFEKGFTGYNGRSGRKSTGLGLYLSKKAADKLSHRITVESVVGKGSTFIIDLNSSQIEIE